jgi:2-methylcitrate dehydratase PrpD
MDWGSTSNSGEPLTRRLSRFIVGLDLADVPEDVQHKAKLHLLDCLGCGIAGASSELCERIRRFLSVEHGPGPIGVLGSEISLGPGAAAFANAAAINALDFDDGFEVQGRGMGHPGATLVAAAMSAALGKPDMDGRSLLTALIAGYEVNNRLIWSMQPSIERFQVVYGVSQHQSIGAAAVYGRLLGLDVDSMENALGLAATLSPVPSLRKYNWDRRPLISLKDFVAPAAEAGVRAVLLDRAALIGSKSVLDGASGYWRMAGSDRFEPDLLVGGLGQTWTLGSNSLKPYPACRWMHCCLEAFEQVRDRERLWPSDMVGVVLRTSSGLAADFMDPRPRNMVDAQFSFPFAIAALGYCIPASTWHRSEVLNDPKLLELADRVTAEVDATADTLMSEMRRPAGSVVVCCRHSSHESEFIEYPLGGLQRPLSCAHVQAKFFGNVTPVLGEKGALELAARVLEIDTTGQIGRVFALTHTPSFAGG